MDDRMNKKNFVSYLADENSCTKVEAEKALDIVTNSIISAVGEGKEISLAGFGIFTANKVAARDGRNPRTGETIKIAAYNQPKFRAGQKFKDACNNKKSKK